jgi:hypothetical protein
MMSRGVEAVGSEFKVIHDDKEYLRIAEATLGYMRHCLTFPTCINKYLFINIYKYNIGVLKLHISLYYYDI